MACSILCRSGRCVCPHEGVFSGSLKRIAWEVGISPFRLAWPVDRLDPNTVLMSRPWLSCCVPFRRRSPPTAAHECHHLVRSCACRGHRQCHLGGNDARDDGTSAGSDLERHVDSTSRPAFDRRGNGKGWRHEEHHSGQEHGAERGTLGSRVATIEEKVSELDRWPSEINMNVQELSNIKNTQARLRSPPRRSTGCFFSATTGSSASGPT